MLQAGRHRPTTGERGRTSPLYAATHTIARRGTACLAFPDILLAPSRSRRTIARGAQQLPSDTVADGACSHTGRTTGRSGGESVRGLAGDDQSRIGSSIANANH